MSGSTKFRISIEIPDGHESPRAFVKDALYNFLRGLNGPTKPDLCVGAMGKIVSGYRGCEGTVGAWIVEATVDGR